MMEDALKFYANGPDPEVAQQTLTKLREKRLEFAEQARRAGP